MIAKPTLTLSTLLFAFVAAVAAPVLSAEKTVDEKPVDTPPAVVEKPAPYDDRMVRFAEILGSVHYLRNLCKGGEDEWRRMAAALIAEEARGEPLRTARFTAAFNRGYRSFAATYVRCTPQALAAEEKYRAEGATLATEMTARFGN